MKTGHNLMTLPKLDRRTFLITSDMKRFQDWINLKGVESRDVKSARKKIMDRLQSET